MSHLPSELHFRFLLEAHDDDLPHMCRLNRLYADLCEEEWFWKKRTKLKYKPFLYLKKNFHSYRELYRALSKRALYIHFPHPKRPFGDYHIFNNIEDAYSYLRRRNGYNSFLPPIDDIYLPINKEIFGSIYIIFQEEGLAPRDTDNLLFGIVPDEGYPYHTENLDTYIHPQLPYLPSFSTDERYITFGQVTPENVLEPITYLGKETNSFLLRIFKEGENHTLELANFIIRYVNDPDHSETFEYWPPLKVFVRNKFPILFVKRINEDIEFMVMPEEYHEQFSTVRDNTIHVDEGRLFDTFEEIKDKFLWYSMEEGHLFPLEEKDSLEYNYYNRQSYYIPM